MNIDVLLLNIFNTDNLIWPYLKDKFIYGKQSLHRLKAALPIYKACMLEVH